MKRLISAFFALLVLLAFPITASAAYPPVMDEAGLLSQEEYQSLQDTCLRLRENYGLDFAICTTASLEGKSARDFADDWYDEHNYSENGVLFLLAMEEREYHITTSGDAILLLSDSDLMMLEDSFLPLLSEGDYYGAFSLFLQEAPGYLEAEQPSLTYYDAEGNLYAVYEQESSGVNLLASLGLGGIIAGLALLVMRSGMNTKKARSSAGDYQVANSFRLHTRQDLFLYSNVSKRPKPQQTSGGSGGSRSSVHRSSSGRSHGGRGGKF